MVVVDIQAVRECSVRIQLPKHVLFGSLSTVPSNGFRFIIVLPFRMHDEMNA